MMFIANVDAVKILNEDLVKLVSRAELKEIIEQSNENIICLIDPPFVVGDLAGVKILNGEKVKVFDFNKWGAFVAGTDWDSEDPDQFDD